MTASGSTFQWWIAYLLRDGATIFYNSQITDEGNDEVDQHDYDMFLEEWIGLTEKNGQVYEETKWWYERNKVV